jgi:tetratricopeptide (TPR) repeat protein
MLEINPDLQSKINQIAKKGDSKANSGNWAGQIEKYLEVWELIPEPKHNWDGGTWIIGGIAEAFYQSEDFSKAKEFFVKGLQCFKGEQNSFIQLRLGQIYCDDGDLENSKHHLKEAWHLSEGRIFVGEPKKYRDFLMKS